MKGRELTPQLSQSSILSLADSHTEFFDACEVLLSASSSENEVRLAGGGTLGKLGWGPERLEFVDSQPRLLSLATRPDLLGLCPCSEVSAGNCSSSLMCFTPLGSPARWLPQPHPAIFLQAPQPQHSPDP